MKIITQQTKDIIKEAFYLAELDKSKLREFDRDLYGNSGNRIKHTINNICGFKENLVYVELGVYRGSTLIAANYQNKLISYGIDDFTIDMKEGDWYKETGWNNPKIAVKELLDRYKFSNVTLFESEATKLDIKKIPKKIDILHYDLDQHHANVEQVLRHYILSFDKYTILLISNWNSIHIRNSFANFAYRTPDIEVEKIAEQLSSTTGDSLNWYNGFAAFVFNFKTKETEKTNA